MCVFQLCSPHVHTTSASVWVHVNMDRLIVSSNGRIITTTGEQINEWSQQMLIRTVFISCCWGSSSLTTSLLSSHTEALRPRTEHPSMDERTAHTHAGLCVCVCVFSSELYQPTVFAGICWAVMNQNSPLRWLLARSLARSSSPRVCSRVCASYICWL